MHLSPTSKLGYLSFNIAVSVIHKCMLIMLKPQMFKSNVKPHKHQKNTLAIFTTYFTHTLMFTNNHFINTLPMLTSIFSHKASLTRQAFLTIPLHGSRATTGEKSLRQIKVVLFDHI